ncbi:MAG: protein kinase domain-containing protein [Chloroflexota bacterium]
MPPTPGEYLYHDRYRIDGILGRGGMGSIYQGWDVSLNIPVAIKENLELSEKAQKQFNTEAGLLARLSHPHLPRVTNYFIVPERGQYLVMDFIAGEDLKSILQRKGRLPEKEVLGWVGQIVSALDYLHSQNPPVIHRDIKPSNIRIATDGRAILVDFGIAKIYDGEKSTTTGARAVSPGYSPPEQYGEGLTDRRSDIYALGATLYHLLTGVEPPESVLRLVHAVETPAPRALAQHISPQVEGLILKSIEVTTDRRYQSIYELREALKACAALEDDVPLPPAAEPAGGRLGEPHRPAATQPGAGQTPRPARPMRPAAPARPAYRWYRLAGPAALLALLAIAAGQLFNPARARLQDSHDALPAAANPAAGPNAADLAEALPTEAAARPPGSAAAAPTPGLPTAAAALVFAPSAAAGPTPTHSQPAAASASPASAPAAYTVAALLQPPDKPPLRAAAARDGFAYLLSRQGRLYTYDIRPSLSGTGVTSYHDPLHEQQLQNAVGMLRVAGYLYVYGNAGIEVLDLAQPAQPALLRRQKDLSILNMALTGQYLVAFGMEALLVYDISLPQSPQPLERLSSPPGVSHFAGVMIGSRLYVSEYRQAKEGGRTLLKVYDFSQAPKLRELERIDTGEIAYHLLEADGYLVRCTVHDLELWDVSRQDYPARGQAERTAARTCLYDRGNLLSSEAAFRLHNGRLAPLLPVANPPGAPGRVDALPYISAAADGALLLTQPNRVLVLLPEPPVQ